MVQILLSDSRLIKVFDDECTNVFSCCCGREDTFFCGCLSSLTYVRIILIERSVMMTNHIALFEPLMPANTGNIARTCAGTDTVLHLIRPLGFSLDDKHMKRAGLDYWDKVNVQIHDDLDDFLAAVSDPKYLYLITKFSDKIYTDIDYSDTAKDHYFLFGKETTGLPEKFMRENQEKCLRIPMTDNIRALNLSNTCALVIYEVVRQQHFVGMELTHRYQHDKLH